jgi:hypothetical protein
MMNVQKAIADRMSGLPFWKIAELHGTNTEAMRKILNANMTPEDKKVAAHKAMSIGAKKGHKKDRKRKPHVEKLILYTCTGNPANCLCGDCVKQRGGKPGVEQISHRVYKDFGVAAR